MRLLEAKSCSWTLEQPMSSLMKHHPRITFKHVAVTWMGMFGARTKKHSCILGNKSWIKKLERALDNTR
eukprot:10128119-Alexandrium_andersonii.AAC.1